MNEKKYKVVIRTVYEEVREVGANSTQEVQELIKEQGVFVGRFIEPNKPVEISGKVYDKKNELVISTDFLG